MINFDLSRLLRMPEICKPAQLLNGLILIICIGSATQVSPVGLLWFIIIIEFIISAVATALFAVGMQDVIVSSLAGDRAVPWGMIEMAYSLVFTILNGASVWMCLFKLNNAQDVKGGGYVAGAIFFFIHTALFALPAYIYFERNKEEERNREIIANPRNLDDNATDFGYQA